MRKFIILEVGKPPQFEGEWTIGEAQAVLQATLAWLGRIPLMSVEDKQKQETKKQEQA